MAAARNAASLTIGGRPGSQEHFAGLVAGSGGILVCKGSEVLAP